MMDTGTSNDSREVPAWGRLVAFAATIGMILITIALRNDAGDAEVLGISAPVWILAVACYLLGGVTTWASTRR